MKERVFISYKRVDQSRVFKIKENIESAIKEKCWIDQQEIPSDAKWDKEITSAIDGCEVLVFILSKEHTRIKDLAQDWTYKEISYAFQCGKHIEILKIDDVLLPEWINDFIPTIDVIHINNSEKLNNLYSKLGKLLCVANDNKIKSMPKGIFEIDGLFYQSTEDCLSVEVVESPDKYSSFIIDIPDSIMVNGYEYQVVRIGENAFYECDNIRRCIIPDSVTCIANNAFCGCKSLYSISISNNLLFIGNYAFYGCTSLRSINIPDSVIEIGTCAFIRCTSLTSIIIPFGVSMINDRTFEDCTSLKSINIPDSVIEIGICAFSYCTSLESMVIPPNVKTIGTYAFQYCSSLTSIVIPKSVEYIDYSFRGCTSLKSIVVKEGNCRYDSRNNSNAIIETETNKLLLGCINTIIPKDIVIINNWAFSNLRICKIDIPEGVIMIKDEAFVDCKYLYKVTLPNTLEHIGMGAFWGCSGLLQINIPEGVICVEDYAFNSCSSLLSIKLPKSLNCIGQTAFSGCESLVSIIVENGNEKFDSRDNCNGIIETATDTLLLGCPNTTIPKSVTSIGKSAFSNYKELPPISLHEG